METPIAAFPATLALLAPRYSCRACAAHPPPVPPSSLPSPSRPTLGHWQASVTVRRLYAAFSPLAAVRHFRADAAEAVHRLTTRPARGVSLLGVFGRPRYAVDVGRLLVPTVVASVVIQLAANAVAGGALAHLLAGGAGGGAGGGAASGDVVAVAAVATTMVPSAVSSLPSMTAVVEGLGMGAGLVANAWLASTTLRFLNTLVTERDAVLYDSLRGSVAAVASERMAGGEEERGEAPDWVHSAVGDVRPVGTLMLVAGGARGDGRCYCVWHPGLSSEKSACTGSSRSCSERTGRLDLVCARNITDIRLGLLWTFRVVCGRSRCAPVLGGHTRRGGGSAVAVVGLLHVNGILRRWEAANAQWESTRACSMAPPAAAPLHCEDGGTNGDVPR